MECGITSINITGVTAIEPDPGDNVATIRYEDTDTSIHAFTPAVSTVNYWIQSFPLDAPLNPHHDN